MKNDLYKAYAEVDEILPFITIPKEDLKKIESLL